MAYSPPSYMRTALERAAHFLADRRLPGPFMALGGVQTNYARLIIADRPGVTSFLAKRVEYLSDSEFTVRLAAASLLVERGIQFQRPPLLTLVVHRTPAPDIPVPVTRLIFSDELYYIGAPKVAPGCSGFAIVRAPQPQRPARGTG